MTDEQKLAQGTEGTEQENKAVEFDAAAFGVETPVVVAKVADDLGDKDKAVDTELKTQDSEDTSFSWGDPAPEESEEAKATRLENERIASESTDSDDDKGVEQTQEQIDAAAKVVSDAEAAKAAESSLTDNDSFKQLNEQLGTKFETVDELKAHLVEIDSRSQVAPTNDAISNLNKLKENSNESLVRMDLERQGFQGDDLENAMDKLTDNGMIEIEAKKILNTVDKAIKREQDNIAKSEAETGAKQQQDYEDNVKALAEQINGTETMFGFKMAKDPESLVKVRAEHQEYITSGDFLGDVTKDAESINEAAWLWKHRKTLMNAIGNKGEAKGKAEILGDIGNLELGDVKRIKSPDSNSGEFNPAKFTTPTQ